MSVQSTRMCGICGIVDWSGGPVDSSAVEAMRDMMIPRGPDDAGLHVENGVGLGHRRLSIIDLSSAGHQPMANEDGAIRIVYNGEIYNFLDLRGELAAAGHRFASRTDTEVLIHGYEQWGLEGLISRIVGMFAFAIWDRNRRQLHLVRDRLGKKPLFYRQKGDVVVFASDIKAIWRQADGVLDVNETAIDEFLYYTAISQNRTIYKGVFKLPAGHWATFSQSGMKSSAYWRMDFSRKESKSLEDWLEGLDYHLRRAVKRRLIADVPLGGFLSGGVDSSCVCALMAQEGTHRPRTFSVGFEQADRFDERKFSRIVAGHIDSDHKELVVQPDVAPILSNLVWQYGEPYGDSSMIPTYLIAQEARKHVTVVLTGDGGDEGFAGYSRHLRANLPQKYAAVPGFITRGIIPMLARMLSALAPRPRLVRNFLRNANYLSGSPDALAYSTCWYDVLRNDLYSDQLMRRLNGFHPLNARQSVLGSLSGLTSLDRAMEYLMRTTLCEDFLAKVDVATMAHSLEARCPFLDVELLSFAMTIPSEVLVKDHQPKAFLKRYVEGLIPPQVIYRKKHGFAVPIRLWFQDQWHKPLRDVLLSEQALSRGLFKHEVIRRVLDEHAAGRRNHAARLWTLLVLEVWNRLFVDRTMKPGDPVLMGVG